METIQLLEQWGTCNVYLVNIQQMKMKENKIIEKRLDFYKEQTILKIINT